MLNIVCDRLCGGLANAGIQARRMVAADVHDWLLRWFNPRPAMLGPSAEDRERFYALARYPDEAEDRSEEHTSELQSPTRTSYAVFCLNTTTPPPSPPPPPPTPPHPP